MFNFRARLCGFTRISSFIPQMILGSSLVFDLSELTVFDDDSVEDVMNLRLATSFSIMKLYRSLWNGSTLQKDLVNSPNQARGRRPLTK